jgi:hypothetical protein
MSTSRPADMPQTSRRRAGSADGQRPITQVRRPAPPATAALSLSMQRECRLSSSATAPAYLAPRSGLCLVATADAESLAAPAALSRFVRRRSVTTAGIVSRGHFRAPARERRGPRRSRALQVERTAHWGRRIALPPSRTARQHPLSRCGTAVRRRSVRAAAGDQWRPHVGPEMTQSKAPTGSSGRTSSQGPSSSHPYVSKPTSRRRPPLPRRMTSKPRR